jgi:predicted nucleotidyltransferase component of viral defense system
MKESKPNIKLIELIAEDLTIDSSFIEKDWYVTQILHIMQTLNNKKHCFIFAGGTCLSKAYKIIERFSEDIDFKISGNFSDRNERRKL